MARVCRWYYARQCLQPCVESSAQRACMAVHCRVPRCVAGSGGCSPRLRISAGVAVWRRKASVYQGMSVPAGEIMAWYIIAYSDTSAVPCEAD